MMNSELADTFSRIARIVLGVALLAGCSRSPPQMDGPGHEGSRGQPSAVETMGPSGSAPISGMGAAGEGRLRSVGSKAESWDVAVKTATPEDQVYLEFVQDKYPGIVEFSSQEERNRLEGLSIPLPEEWLAANRLSDLELEQMMNNGDARATVFYADRMTDRFQEILDAAGTLEPSKVHRLAPERVDELMRLNVQSSTAALMALRQNPSAFTAYVYGRESAIIGGATFPIAASYEVAHDLGDERAPAFMRRFEAMNGPTAAGATLASYKHIRKMAGL